MNNFEVAITGVKMACKILEIPEPKIYFIDDELMNSKKISALFRRNEYEIFFNEKLLIKAEWIEVIVTAFHESRHAYQWYSIENDKNEAPETLKKWKSEFEGYTTISGKNNPLSDIDYLKQDIEIDAIRFCHFKINELFGVKTIIPNEINKDIIK